MAIERRAPRVGDHAYFTRALLENVDPAILEKREGEVVFRGQTWRYVGEARVGAEAMLAMQRIS